MRTTKPAPPTYTECINGSGDIGDDEEDELMGDTSFTPRYAYAPDGSRNFCPPPAYSEVSGRPRSLQLSLMFDFFHSIQTARSISNIAMVSVFKLHLPLHDRLVHVDLELFLLRGQLRGGHRQRVRVDHQALGVCVCIWWKTTKQIKFCLPNPSVIRLFMLTVCINISCFRICNKRPVNIGQM